MTNRRQFERFTIPEDAIAIDDAGQRLGRVTVAGGGGMSIALEDNDACPYKSGQRFRVTVIEPGPGVRHTIDVVVRYRHEDSLGLEFVSGDAV